MTANTTNATRDGVLIEYSTGTPTAIGVYACRVQDPQIPGFLSDKFLMWHGNAWSYLRSAERWRDEVPYWIGPLRRRMPAHPTGEQNVG